MADNLIQKSHKNSDKNKYNNVVHRTTSESLRLNESEKGVTHPTSLQAAHNPRKISSFQITSVTVGSRVSTDAGEDSADDLDESHTDDISRVTDIENETPSFSEDTFSKDEVFYNASSTSLGCAPVIPTSSQYGLAIVGQDSTAGPISAVPNNNSSEVSDMHVSVNASTGGIINFIGNAKPQEGMKEIQEHVRNERFKVVKIESTEPFRRGRWVCMDYLDHTTSQPNAIIVNNNLDIVENNSLQAPDSGVVINDSQHDDVPNTNDLTVKGPKEIQPVMQLEQTIQKQLPILSPGQSLTQPLNMVQQQLPTSQTVNVQSPPLEMPQQMPNQGMQQSQVPQQHPQSMTHITLQNTQNHPQQTQQQVQQIPQSFPQHQLQQVIAQSQGIPMQQIPIHQQMPQQMQQMPNQAQMQLNQHLSQTQMPNMQQIPQQIPQMQAMQGQGQMQQVPNQQSQMQQMQMQQIQSQPNPQQMHQIQQTQIPNMAQSHHLQNQQPMGSQPPQLQHLPSQAQMQAMQNQQLPNHIQQLQMQPQVPQLTSANQQIQLQTQMHQMPPQQQQPVVPNMHAQMQQQGIQSVQQQYNQAVSQTNAQAIINPAIPSSQQTIVQSQHSVPQYHTQQSQMSQQGQTLPQEVLTSIASSQQGNSMAIASQPQAATLPANLQNLSGQTQGHTMAPQQQQVPQANMQMMAQAPQNMQMIDTNQANMQMPTSDQMYIQQTGQMPVNQHMIPQQAQSQIYVQSQQVPMAHQNMGMPMQQSLPVNMVPAQTPMPMYASSVVPVEAVSGTNSPVVSLPGTTGYPPPVHDAQGFGSPVSGVVSHVVSNVPPSESAPEVMDVPASDAADGKDDQQVALPMEDESINGLALALGSSGAGTPADGAAAEQRDTAASSRAPSPPPADRQPLSSASGTSAVAIDNKIEQAMDLVKSHLMFAVREEVEVLKERIAELMERINQLELENTYLRAHASQDTLASLPAAKPAPPPPPAS